MYRALEFLKRESGRKPGELKISTPLALRGICGKATAMPRWSIGNAEAARES
jgi:hypothetical protein